MCFIVLNMSRLQQFWFHCNYKSAFYRVAYCILDPALRIQLLSGSCPWKLVCKFLFLSSWLLPIVLNLEVEALPPHSLWGNGVNIQRASDLEGQGNNQLHQLGIQILEHKIRHWCWYPPGLGGPAAPQWVLGQLSTSKTQVKLSYTQT